MLALAPELESIFAADASLPEDRLDGTAWNHPAPPITRNGHRLSGKLGCPKVMSVLASANETELVRRQQLLDLS